MPSMLTSVAFCVDQVRRVDCPRSIVVGFAESDAVGAGGGGGGACGVGCGFFAQPATSASAIAALIAHFVVCDFLISF
jgi:hypothetical protein